ncbi:hypothetical protein GE107_16295 [Cohnella sp. CFH 77786]|uniref:hypothetical protein n=1 Tax=Cohnella sp. CFH 77786 TaxID=2662265 RepID=UPI001C60E0DA|nr:hypothetical protein [Cohnella sp. CFH 77786]MBW5447619.1 hypothetical protein [Cohnella sp. CFH 77786]
MMDHEGIRSILLRSIRKLIEKDLFLVTNKVKEECINHRLGVYLEKALLSSYKEGPDYNVDLEYNKNYTNPKEIITDKGELRIRPDILIHKRNSFENLLAVEAKKLYPSRYDREKLEHLLKPPYNYEVTALVSYLPEREYMKVTIRTKDKTDELKISKFEHDKDEPWGRNL